MAKFGSFYRFYYFLCLYPFRQMKGVGPMYVFFSYPVILNSYY